MRGIFLFTCQWRRRFREYGNGNSLGLQKIDEVSLEISANEIHLRATALAFLRKRPRPHEMPGPHFLRSIDAETNFHRDSPIREYEGAMTWRTGIPFAKRYSL